MKDFQKFVNEAAKIKWYSGQGKFEEDVPVANEPDKIKKRRYQ